MSNLRNINDLHEWNHNHDLRLIEPEGYERLKKNLELGQHSTLLIREDGTVLGGNNRLRAMKELGGFTEVEVTVLTFGQDDQGYYPIFNGRIYKRPDGTIPVHFQSIEQGEVECALSHNTNPAFYNKDGLVNLVSQFPEIAIEKYDLQFEEPISLDDVLASVVVPGADGEETGQEQLITCPHCGESFPKGGKSGGN